MNHAVLAVGYDDNDNWFVKNSWGTSWGDNGFITLAPGNTCGITSYAYRAIWYLYIINNNLLIVIICLIKKIWEKKMQLKHF